jgi:hypothetical protein
MLDERYRASEQVLLTIALTLRYKVTALVGRIANTSFLALGVAATAAGIFGAFATALVNGFLAPLIVVACYVLLVAGCVIISSTILFRRLGVAQRVVLVTLALALIVVLTPFPRALSLYQYPGERIHFLRDLPQYARYVERLPHDGNSGITYDETDEVALPSGRQSKQWRFRMRNTDLTCGGDAPIGMVEPMGGHWYLTAFGC